MKNYLLDTDICIFFLQGRFNLSERIDEIRPEHCFISEITLAELWFGAENSSRREEHLSEVLFFEQKFRVLPIRPVFSIYAREKARLRRSGTPLAEFDLLIGATAIFNNLIMATGNTRHFQKIEGLEIENWTQ